MHTFTFAAGISVRYYGRITTTADTLDEAIAIINTPDFQMFEHFEPNGGGEDDISFDILFPAVNLMAVMVDEDPSTEKELECHPRLPNEMIADAGPEMLALLHEALSDWPQFEDEDEPVNGGDMVEWFGEFREKIKTTIAKAEGS